MNNQYKSEGEKIEKFPIVKKNRQIFGHEKQVPGQLKLLLSIVISNFSRFLVAKKSY